MPKIYIYLYICIVRYNYLRKIKYVIVCVVFKHVSEKNFMSNIFHNERGTHCYVNVDSIERWTWGRIDRNVLMKTNYVVYNCVEGVPRSFLCWFKTRYVHNCKIKMNKKKNSICILFKRTKYSKRVSGKNVTGKKSFDSFFRWTYFTRFQSLHFPCLSLLANVKIRSNLLIFSTITVELIPLYNDW